MRVEVAFSVLLAVSVAIVLWQFAAAFVFPLRRKVKCSHFPNITILKPLKGVDRFTENCLKSWMGQKYDGRIQIIFVLDSENDPAFKICEKLAREHPGHDVSIIICNVNYGANSKVSKLVHAMDKIKYEIVVISDADVMAPADLLSSSAGLFNDNRVGLVCCLYSLANPEHIAMKVEAAAINGDFWSQVLQARSLKPMNFALGAVMMVRRDALEQIGGFKAVVNKLADDYWLGRLISEAGWKVELSRIPVEIYHENAGWKQVWFHQLRWARTIRVCEPLPYFFSIISNTIFFAILYLIFASKKEDGATVAMAIFLIRSATSAVLQKRLTERTFKFWNFYAPVIKDIFQVALWISSFTGNSVKWRGKTYRVFKDGSMIEKV